MAGNDMRFDASQYDFFGKDLVEEVELGGLEEQDAAGLVGFDVDEDQMSGFGARDEVV